MPSPSSGFVTTLLHRPDGHDQRRILFMRGTLEPCKSWLRCKSKQGSSQSSYRLPAAGGMFTFLNREDVQALTVQSIRGNGPVETVSFVVERTLECALSSFGLKEAGPTVRRIRQVFGGEELRCRLNSEPRSVMRN